MQPAFALSPLVVAVVLSSFSVMLMGFPVMCWQSSGSSLGLGRKKVWHTDAACCTGTGASRYCARGLWRGP
ncbi:hypothetical protein B0H13DRAFT_2091918 [Mycena leptocephala]|nr:hypothetical protein B0H13DRAFT_2091918 [Mycena leptocephala]